MLSISRGRATDALTVFSLAVFLLAGACSDAPAASTDDANSQEPAGAGPGDDGSEVDARVKPGATTGSSTPTKPGSTTPNKVADGGPAPAKSALDGGTVAPADPAVTSNSDAAVPSTPSTASDASTPEGDGGFVPPWMKRTDLGKGDGKDVVTIGDSWMAGPFNGAGIQAGLDRAGTKYRHYAVTATQLLNGEIPGQYDRAKAANPKISTVIMTAGGNDVMFTPGACSTPEACGDFGAKISDGLDKLWSKMSADGVQDVIYVQYSDNAGATPADSRGGSKAVVKVCYAGKLSCHTVPTTDIVAKTDLMDGIHPNDEANDRIAKRIVMMMEERGIRR